MGNLANVKENYDIAEWKIRERYYVQGTNNLFIPPSPTPNDIKNLTSSIDSLLTEAMLDFAYIKRKYENICQRIKLAEKEIFAIIKSDKTKKLTEGEVKGLVTSYIRTHPDPINSINNKTTNSNKPNLYLLESCILIRYTFINAVVTTLKEKKGALVTDNGMLKIESSLDIGTGTGKNNGK